jgi:AraC-like DNA-binding protein
VLIMCSKAQAEVIRELAPLRIASLLWKPLQLSRLLDRVCELLNCIGSKHLGHPHLGHHTSRAADYLVANYGDAVSIGSIAQAIGVSASHLAHLFTRDTGMTLMTYVSRLRVEIASRLLIDVDTKLDSIAESTGFCDASHLSRAFREYLGCRPGEYRRRLRSAPSSSRITPRHILFIDGSMAVAVQSMKSANQFIVARSPHSA